MPIPAVFMRWQLVAERCSAQAPTVPSAFGTWSHLKMVRVSDHVLDAGCCSCLLVRGSMLLCGGDYNDDDEDGDFAHKGFVVVLDADTRICQHTLLLFYPIESLLSVRGEV